MQLSLIGMSGAGKSHWSAKFLEYGFTLYCCDDLIEKKLEPDLIGSNGKRLNMGEWMGFPYQPHYKEREAKYLAYEIEVLTEIFDVLRQSQDNIIVDTTGSVIYTGTTMMQKLRQHTTVVHLETPLAVQAQMLEAYRVNQRPVVWNDLFEQRPGETGEEAIDRCYSTLISSRETTYRHYADVILEHAIRHQPDFEVEAFIDVVKAVRS